MIDSIRGPLIASEEGFAIVEAAGGVRFRLEVPASTSSALPQRGSEVILQCRLIMNTNEGTFLLFGFASDMERECFDLFVGLTGIGPKKALAILSQIEIAGFARAIVAEDLTYLSKIKGIGKKTAERLVVELREKMAPYVATPVGGKSESGVTLPAIPGIKDAVEALMVLGCRQAVAEKAIAEAVKELGQDAPVDKLVRAGLRYR